LYMMLGAPTSVVKRGIGLERRDIAREDALRRRKSRRARPASVGEPHCGVGDDSGTRPCRYGMRPGVPSSSGSRTSVMWSWITRIGHLEGNPSYAPPAALVKNPSGGFCRALGEAGTSPARSERLRDPRRREWNS